jgi:hypothetical protein
MVALLAAIVAALMTVVAARLMSGASIALPGLLLAGFVLPGALDATHHWFSTIAAMCAVLVLLNGETMTHIAVAGGLCGVTALYTQNKGLIVASGFVAYLALKQRRDGTSVRDCSLKCMIILILTITVFLVGNIYFIRTSGLGRWWYCLFVFPLRYYGTVDVNNWHVYGHGLRTLGLGTIPFLFVHAIVPSIYGVCIFVVYASRKELTGSRDIVLLVAITGIAMFLSVALAPSWKRLCAVSPPAVILLSWLLYRAGPIGNKLRIGLAATAIVLAGLGVARSQLRWSGAIDLPVGKAAIIDMERYQEYRYLVSRTRVGQFMFAPPPVLFMLGVRNPAPIDLFGPFDYTRPEQVAATIRALEQDRVPLLLLNRGMFESLMDVSPVSDHLDPIRVYLACRYRLTATFKNDDEIWETVGGTGPCSN